MKLIVPNRLNAGDAVGVISPAGASDEYKISVVLDALKSLSLNPVVHEQNYENIGYLAGDDASRVSAIHDFFKDDNIKAIFCVRGGYGCVRLLDKLDYNLIKKNPKILVGMSDITALQSAILEKTGLEVYHGPMSLHFNGSEKQFALSSLKSILFDNSRQVDLDPELVVGSGKFKGRLIGGNLKVISSLIGSSYLYDFSNSILFIEEVGEFLYAIDRDVINMKYAGLLKSVKAVVVGQVEILDNDAFAYSIEDILKQHLPEGIPIVIGAKFGHLNHHLTLPIGRQVTLDLKNGSGKLIL